MSNYRLVSDLLQEHPLHKLMLIRQEHGEKSPEFKKAQLAYQTRSAKIGAGSQIRKPANQAMLYERGY